jgi:ELWxxDGT repeat protein
LFFRTVNAAHNGFALWKSDGTEAGTTVVSDVFPPGDLDGLTPSGGKLFFAARFHGSGTDLWTSDGTAAGTAVVKFINPRTMDSRPEELTNVNGTLYFAADDGLHGRELWKSDGTEAGTVLVKDVNPGSASSYPSHLTNVHGTLFFEANATASGFELWKSDGTEASTVLVKAFSGGVNPSAASLTDVNGTLFFRVFAYPEQQLWKSDGTPGSTVLVKDFGTTFPYDPGASSSFLVNVNGTVFFAAADPVNGWELWESDGTAAGTHIVKDINPGSGSSSPRSLTNVNGRLFFTATDGTNGRELWKSDGTAAGTVLVKVINSGRGNGLDFLNTSLTDVDGTLFFVAKDGTQGYQLWKSDGTGAGTVLVKEFVPPNPFSAPPSYLVNVNGTLFFMATDSVNGTTLWKSDGTEAGTVIVSDGVPGGNDLVNVNGTLYFSVLRIEQGKWQREVWQSDGTASGTFPVFSAGPGAQLSPSHLTNVNGRLFFSADDGLHGNELWVVGASEPSEAPTVTSVVLNEGQPAGSPVTTITFHFSQQVSIGAGAFELIQDGVGPVGLTVTTSVVDGVTVAVLAFSGGTVSGGALADGTYSLFIHGDRIRDGQGLALGGAFAGDKEADVVVQGGASDASDLTGFFHDPD